MLFQVKRKTASIKTEAVENKEGQTFIPGNSTPSALPPSFPPRWLSAFLDGHTPMDLS